MAQALVAQAPIAQTSIPPTAIPTTSIAEEAPSSAELLERMRARFATCATCRITGVIEECWFEEGDVRSREQQPFEVHFERAGMRLRVTSATQDGRWRKDGHVAVIRDQQLLHWDADESEPDPVEPVAQGLREWWVPDEIEVLLEALAPELVARVPRGSTWKFTSPAIREEVDGIDCWRLGGDPPEEAMANGASCIIEQLWLTVTDERPVRWIDRWHRSDGMGRERTARFEVTFDAALPADAFALVEPPQDGRADFGGVVERVAVLGAAGAAVFGPIALLLLVRRRRALAVREATIVLVVQALPCSVMFVPRLAGEVALGLAGWDSFRLGDALPASVFFVSFVGLYLIRFTRYDDRFQQSRMLWGIAPRHAAQLLPPVALAEGVDLQRTGEGRFEDRHTGEEWRVDASGWAASLRGPHGQPERFRRVVAAVVTAARAQQLTTRSKALPVFCGVQVVLVSAIAWWAMRMGF
jgi:hypothetical protein